MAGAALFILTPGASTALVTRNAIRGGPAAAVFTAGGIVLANAMYAVGSALGLSFLLARSPAALQAIQIGGALYLSFVGLQTLWRAWRSRPQPERPTAAAHDGGPGGSAAVRIGEGLLTNLLNPPVVLFYVSYVPQFVGPREPYFRTFITLAAIHIGMAFSWLSFYGASIGSLGAALGRPAVRRAIEAVTGVALVALAWRLGFARV
jgi:threonine/homoserine/homoserine lactone efflux protein